METQYLALLGLTLLASLIITDAGSFLDQWKTQRERAAQARAELEWDERGLKEGLSCKEEGQGCRGVPRCCGELQCYHKDGFSLIKDGVCVDCVREGNSCSRDSQCCSDLQCDKGNVFWINGNCQRYRRSGACYRDGQCVEECQKKWYQLSGSCS